jgi:hypothetical protein
VAPRLPRCGGDAVAAVKTVCRTSPLKGVADRLAGAIAILGVVSTAAAITTLRRLAA